MLGRIERERIGIGEQILLCRRSHIEQVVRFTILGVVGEGGSAICYEAEMDGKRGRLKEFYPVFSGEVLELRRDERGQLLPADGNNEDLFQGLCRDFVNTYDILDQLRREDHRAAVLNNYIPACQLFFGRTEDGSAGSVYVWTDSDKVGRDFGDYLAEVRSAPRELPEHKLYNIINTLITLTDCIRIFHNADLLHLDIKPSNFLVPFDSEMNINTGNISLYDVNSVYSLHSGLPRFGGTAGFRAPELLRGKPENRSDIYSIGAMLYYGIVISEEYPSGLYEDSCYGRIEELLKDSPLIRVSETNSSLSVKYILTRILRKTLAPKPRQRYDCCEELIEDLKTARAYLLPDIFGKCLPLEQRLAILDQDEREHRDPTAIIQDLLYRTPLYAVPLRPGEPIDVLVVGAGTYGQKFIDICLQTGQMPDHPLRITAVSRNAGLDKEVYLHYRPALTQFVDVDGGGLRDSYASLDFVELDPSFEVGNVSLDRSIVDDIFRRRRYHYVFISLGDDQLDRDVAAAFVDRKVECPVNFVIQSTERSIFQKGMPVYVNDEIGPDTISPELERMAFNTHLSWCDAGALDMQAAKAQFLERYNYNSSMAYVLSIPYKMHSIGIRLEDPQQVAALVEERLRDGKVFRELVMLEHRRWILEKVTAGWQAPVDKAGRLDLRSCVIRGRVADQEQKLHPCLVRSRQDMPLKDENFDWDGDTRDLDPLDRMSVELHRTFSAAAEELRQSRPLRSDDILALCRLTEGQPERVQRAFSRYHQCLQRILQGNEGHSRAYHQYAKELEEAMEVVMPQWMPEIRQRLAWIHRKIFPAIESNLRRDYKAYDEVLVRQIPYILMNVPRPKVVMAFGDGDSGEILDNVAAASVLHPKSLTYLYWWRRDSAAYGISEKLGAVAAYFTRKHIRSQITILVAVPRGLLESARSALVGCPVKVEFLLCEDGAEAVETLALRERDALFDGGTTLFRDQKLEERFRQRIRQRMPYFLFDRKTQRFPVYEGCGYLRYVQGGARIGIEDLDALTGWEVCSRALPEFEEEYQTLRRISFGEDGASWPELCRCLAEYADRQDVLGEISLDDQGGLRTIWYYFPSVGYPGAKKLLQALKEHQVVMDRSELCNCASDTCRIELHTQWELGPLLEVLFSRWYLLVEPDRLELRIRREGQTSYLSIVYDGLSVEMFEPGDVGARRLLEALYQERSITMLRHTGKTVSFVYTSYRMKRLLTQPDALMAICCYYEALEMGCFDDLSCSRGELMLMKGYQPVLVHCVSGVPDRARYYALVRRAEPLGREAKRVMVCSVRPEEAMVREGEAMGITTVCFPQ